MKVERRRHTSWAYLEVIFAVASLCCWARYFGVVGKEMEEAARVVALIATFVCGAMWMVAIIRMGLGRLKSKGKFNAMLLWILSVLMVFWHWGIPVLFMIAGLKATYAVPVLGGMGGGLMASFMLGMSAMQAAKGEKEEEAEVLTLFTEGVGVELLLLVNNWLMLGEERRVERGSWILGTCFLVLMAVVAWLAMSKRGVRVKRSK